MAKQRGKGSGSVRPYKRGGRHVGYRAEVVRMTPGGTAREKNFYRSKTFLFSDGLTKADAERWVRETYAALDAGRMTARTTVGDWLMAWLAVHRTTVAASTYAGDRDTAESHVRPGVGPLNLADLDANQINAWLAGMADAGRSSDQCHKAWGLLRKCLKAHAKYDEGRLLKVKSPKVVRGRRRAMTAAQVRDLIATADSWRDEYPYLGTMIRVWLECCARPGEVLAARWEDYDGRTLWVRRSICPRTGRPKPPKTEAGERGVGLSRQTASRLDALRPADGVGVMFPAARGGHMQQRNFGNRVWLKLVKAAGLAGWVPYELRHTAASHLVSAGGSLLAIAKRMGHTDPSLILKTYGHCLPDDQAKLTTLLAVVLDPLESTSELAPLANPARPPQAG